MNISLKEHKSSEKLSRIALKAFFKIAELWELSLDEQLNLLGLRTTQKSTLYNWKEKGSNNLPKDTLERISYILGIYKSLQILLPLPKAADNWIKKTNKANLFGGKSALTVMLQGNVSDLYLVRKYLDAQRGGWS
jgi:Protein of unknown function (DUF2384)